MKNRSVADDTEDTNVDLERRRALSRLGLGLSAAYAVPVLLTLSRGAHASGGDGDGGDPDGGDSSGGASASGGSDGASGGSDGSEDPVTEGSGPSVDP
jgi:hypothetical protein